MDEATLRLFLGERLRAYDSNINLDTGSPVNVEVIDPIVRRFSPDPLEPDLKKFCLTRLRQEFPNLAAEEGSALSDLVIKPSQIFLEPLRREVRSVKRQLSLSDSSVLVSDEADALMYNVFVTRKTGDFARIKVRIYFTNPLSVSIGSTNFAFTGRGLRFLPTEPQSITAEGMLLNTDGSLFYFDVNYIAESPGSRYNIAASEIIGVTGLTAATRATNLTSAQFGSNEETTIQMVARGEQSIGERSLTTVPGTVAVLFEQFNDLQILQIIGFNDPEMQRDVITGGSLGAILYQGSDGATPDDGSIGSYTGWFDSASGDFTSRFGPVGTDISSYELTVYVGATLLEYTLGEVVGATRITINDSYEDSDRLLQGETSVLWSIRKKGSLTLSGIPGGILFPDELATEVEIQDDEIHVGGCADMMVKGTSLENKALAVSLIADQDVIARRENAKFTNGSRLVVLGDLTASEFAEITAQSTALYVESGPNEGPYKILAKTETAGPTYNVYIQITDPSTLTTTDPGHSFTLVDDIDVDLTGPKEIKYEGTDLQTYGGLNVVDTASGNPDFLPVSGVGVTDDDVVEIVNGDDRGVYGIDTGGVAASQITLESAMTQTDGPLRYRIYRLGDGLEMPLLRLKTVEMLDSDLKPRGAYIPYRHPVDAQSNSFQNPGRGAKTGSTIDPDERLTRLSSPDEDVVSSNKTSDFYAAGVRAGDLVNITTTDNRGFYTVTLVGGSSEASGVINDNELQLDGQLTWPSSDMKYDLGAPSYGSFRIFFLEPVTFEARYNSTFLSIELSNGSSIRYRPDPDVYHEYLPTPVTIPTVEMSAASATVAMWPPGAGTNTEIQHLVHDVRAGDKVQITYAPIVGAVDLKSASLDLDNKTLKVDVGSGTETVTFSGTSVDLATVVSQINSQLSKEVASKYITAGLSEHLMLRGDHEITLDGTGTATAELMDDVVFAGDSRAEFMPWYTTGDFAGNTTENDSPDQGTYEVNYPDTGSVNGLVLQDTSGVAFLASHDIPDDLGHYIHLSHHGVQRISSTAMADNVDDLGFYYFDVECISEGYGDTYNIGEDQQATVEGHYSEGWSISVEDTNLSYSMAEVPWLAMSPRILVEGVEDDPDNYAELTGTSIQVNYERMPLVGHVHSFVLEKRNRVVCESPLSRALFPTYIRTYMNYRGGPSVDDAREALVEHIEQTIPEQDLETSDLHDIIRRLGSSKVVQPITVVGIEHRSDRSVWTNRSQDAVSTGRLSAMIPDDDGTTVEGASYLFLEREIS